MKRTLLGLAIIAGISGAAQAQDFDLTDMTPARPGQEVESTSTVTEGNIVVGNNEKEAVAVAHQQLVDNSEDGIRLIQVGSGTGILSIGSAFYQTYDNMNATLLSKRAAYNQAALIAKRQLVSNGKGVDVTCNNLAELTIDTIDTGTDSVANETSGMKERCIESVNGSLAGYVTYDVYDDVDSNQVRISLISTPKTRSQVRENAGAAIVTSDPNALFKQIVTDINTGVLPPMGAKILTHADTGEVILMGYGSAIVRDNDNPRVAKRLKDVAKRQSETRARAALLGTMKGEEVYWQGGFNEEQLESTQQFEYTDPNLQDPTRVKKLDNDRTQFMNQLKASDEYQAIASGTLPAGVQTRNFVSADGHWQYTVAVHSPTFEAIAKEAQREMQGRGSAQKDSSGRAINIYGGDNDKAANPQGASGKVSEDDNL
ncbi:MULTISPECIES: hypothetical protein [unclassified Idiomarina]|uniref:hypothetical protein n=1 Tax=unclassified Idiomarina TaxID=2614829 RepID=UPI000C89D5A6|nr:MULTISPECIES: hypothetical protein [unclassified Idiomarina]MAD54709.1 hypothetical protein [Idiomarinaceae bacterium]NQZ03528.1 hypothetical protein [Idiomarina sp.]|tara:strand:+ start:4593 stop:5879 length:1287 start_codon:yes stop_codon:yes gene_type:complete